jgi:hypothetical membrane protein
MSTTQRDWSLGLYAGIAAVFVSFGGIATAIAVTPGWMLSRHPLSLLGYKPLPTSFVFNGALILASVLAVWFVLELWQTIDDPVRSGALVVLLVSVVSLGLVGVFALPAAPHFLVAVTFFIGLTVGVFIFGVGDVLAGRTDRGYVFVLGAITHLAVWGYWFGYSWLPSGIAIPELAGAFLLALWTLWVSYSLITTGQPDGTPRSEPAKL